MNVLFICKHNRFRSKAAEVLFNFYNQNKKNKAKSAGIHLDVMNVAENVHRVLREKGIENVDNLPRAVDKKLIKWADKIIIVADNVSAEGFPMGKTETWEISDCDQGDLEGIRERVEKIELKVKDLLERLKV